MVSVNTNENINLNQSVNLYENNSLNENKKMNKKRMSFITIILCLLLLPCLGVLITIGFNSHYLITEVIHYCLMGVAGIALPIFVYAIVVFFKNRKASNRLKKYKKVLLSILFSLYVLGCSGFVFILYGPYDGFRTWLITTAMQTMNHQYYCKWFYNDDQIAKVMNYNVVIESGESTDETLVTKKRATKFKDEYDKEILDVDINLPYKIIELNVNGVKGYLAAIYDPSKVKVAVTKNLGRSGQYVTEMAAERNAHLAINAGGFYDPNYSSSGGMPTSITISNGKIMTDNTYTSYNQGGGIIGMTNDDVLVLLKNKTAQQAINMGVRDAVSWGPFLIVNGKQSFIRGNGGWGYAARSAIGQREDGIVLLLVVSSNKIRTKGADMVDLAEIMKRYHAINAANLDGGTSTVMVMPKDIAQSEYNSPCSDAKSDKYCWINEPYDSAGRNKTRPIADAWIVEK